MDDLNDLKILFGKQYLNDALLIREEVFIIGQNVPREIERDSYDYGDDTVHFVAYIDNYPIGAGRIIKHSDGKVYLTRIAVKSSHRNKGIGKIIVKEMLLYLKGLKEKVCYIHAQSYIKKFYEDLNFIPFGEEFEEAGIMHTHMKYNLT